MLVWISGLNLGRAVSEGMVQQLRKGLQLASLQQAVFLCATVLFAASVILGFLHYISVRGALPDIQLYHLRQADQLAAQGDAAEAADAYKIAARVAPDDLEALARLYRVARESDDQQSALWALSRTLRYTPRDPLINLQIADALYQRGDYQQARNFYLRVTRLVPTTAVLAYQLGLVELALGEEPAARHWFRQALALEPHHTLAASRLESLDAVEER